MSMVSIEEDGIVRFLAEGFDQRGDLLDAEEFALALGNSNHHGQFEIVGSGDDGLERDQFRDIEVSHRDTLALSLGQYLSQCLHRSLLARGANSNGESISCGQP